jgi:putative addiction module CopG family antidote
MTVVRKLSMTLPTKRACMDERKVRSGTYASASDVVREALRLWRQQVVARERRLAALDATIARGLDDAEAGRVRPIEDVRASLLRMCRR